MTTVEKSIDLNSIAAVKEFVAVISGSRVTGELKSGPYIVDAQSIMGIFSLDLSKPLTLVVNGEADDVRDLMDNIKEFIL